MIIPPGLTFWQAMQKGLLPQLNEARYLAWLKEQPCVVTGQRPVDVHHLIGHGLRATGRKTTDWLAIPLALHLHRDSAEAIHVIGCKEWERRYGSQLEHAARTLLAAIYAGVLRYEDCSLPPQ